MHSLAFMLLVLAIVVNGVVFARRYFATRPAWAIYSIGNSLAILVLVTVGGVLTASGRGGLPLFGAAVAISFWVSATATRTLGDLG